MVETAVRGNESAVVYILRQSIFQFIMFDLLFEVSIDLHAYNSFIVSSIG